METEVYVEFSDAVISVPAFLVPFCLAALLVFVAVIALTALALGKHAGRLTARREYESLVEKERADAVKRSRAVLGGQFSEQLAPYLPGFPADPTQVRFIGKPVDFIAFCLPPENAGEEMAEILFIEVKTGNSVLSRREREVKKAVEEGRVRYVEYRI